MTTIPQKTLDQKIALLRTVPGSRNFILADAKDADMAFGTRSCAAYIFAAYFIQSVPVFGSTWNKQCLASGRRAR